VVVVGKAVIVMFELFVVGFELGQEFVDRKSAIGQFVWYPE
jgi:hypothetical protein